MELLTQCTSHRHVKQVNPNTDEQIDHERASPTQKVTKDATNGCNVFHADV